MNQPLTDYESLIKILELRFIIIYSADSYKSIIMFTHCQNIMDLVRRQGSDRSADERVGCLDFRNAAVRVPAARICRVDHRPVDAMAHGRPSYMGKRRPCVPHCGVDGRLRVTVLRISLGVPRSPPPPAAKDSKGSPAHADLGSSYVRDGHALHCAHARWGQRRATRPLRAAAVRSLGAVNDYYSRIDVMLVNRHSPPLLLLHQIHMYSSLQRPSAGIH